MLAEEAVRGDHQGDAPAFSLLDHPNIEAALERMLDVDQVGLDRGQEPAVPEQIAQDLAPRALVARARKAEGVRRESRVEPWPALGYAIQREGDAALAGGLFGRVGGEQRRVDSRRGQPRGQVGLVRRHPAGRRSAQPRRHRPDQRDAHSIPRLISGVGATAGGSRPAWRRMTSPRRGPEAPSVNCTQSRTMLARSPRYRRGSSR